MDRSRAVSMSAGEADGTERFSVTSEELDVDRERRRAQYQAAMVKLQAS